MIEKVMQDIEAIADSNGSIEDVRDYVIETLLDLFELPKISKENYPKMIFDYSELDFEKEQFFSDSHFDSENNFIFCAQNNLDSLAEEMMHFINYFFNGTIYKKMDYESPIDYFYSHALAEALGHFAGNALFGIKFDPENIKGTQAYSLYLEHLEFESNIEEINDENFFKKCPLEKILMQDTREISDTFHFLGYNLGQKMFKAYQEKKFFKREIRELIYSDFKEKGSAMDAYLTLVENLE